MLKSWEKRGKRGLGRILGRALKARGNPGAIPDVAALNSILVIRTQNQLGDMLLATPAFRALRARAPHARIDLIASPANADAVRESARFDHVLVFDKREWMRDPSAAARFRRRLREAAYDLAIVLSTVDFSTTSVGLAALSGARRRCGRAGRRPVERDIAADAYHWVLPAPTAHSHQTAANLELVAELGARSCGGAPEIFLSPKESERGRAALEAALGPRRDDSLRIVIHPGAGKVPNRWPAERFGKTATALQAAGHRVCAASGPKERDLLDRMDAGAGAALARLPALHVRELGGALGSADLMIANDTGVMHLGASAGTRVLALFGPTDPKQWCPASPRVFYLEAPAGVLANLSTDAVISGAVALAKHIAGRQPAPDALTLAPRLDP
jgi:ADP-heptose:LPS heptosyltransferase